MPNNGIVSTKTNIPDKFRAESTSEFNTATDMVVVNKALDGINVTQKSVTIDQLGELVASSQSPSTFNVSTSSAIIISKNEGNYGSGPETISDGDSFTISNNELPSGLTWMGPYNSGTEYSNADVVYSIVSSTYTTWVYINSTPTTGQPLPTAPDTFNTYWAQLGTQGPAGSNGVTSLNGLSGTVFVSNNATEYSGGSWYLNPVIFGNTVRLGINKPFMEFSAKFNMSGSGSTPSTTQLIANTGVNEFGFTSSNISISLTAPGQVAITLPAGTLSFLGSKNILTIAQDTDASYSTSNKLWIVKFNMQGFTGSTPQIVFKVFMWDDVTSTWTNNFSDFVSLRINYRRYN